MVANSLVLGMDQEGVIFAVSLGIIGAFVFLVYTVGEVVKSRAREQTRREIAAYLAEGAIGPDQAKELLGIQQSDAEREIAAGVKMGTISSAKAEKLIKVLREEQARADA